MATSIVIDSAGRYAPAVGSGGNLSATAGEALALNDVLYLHTDGKVYKHTGTEAQAAALVGICDGTYALNATASYWGEGAVATGLSGLTIGTEYWARGNGEIDTWANLTSTHWTRSLGVAKTTTSLEIHLGPTQQKP